MANALYDKAKEGFLNGDIDLIADDIKVVLVNTVGTGTLYSVNTTTHTFLSDIPAAARIATSGNLVGKTTTGGAFEAGDASFTNVSGVQCEALVIYQDTLNATTSRLIAFLDQGTGLPITPNGGNITVQWDNVANYIFKLNA